MRGESLDCFTLTHWTIWVSYHLNLVIVYIEQCRTTTAGWKPKRWVAELRFIEISAWKMRGCSNSQIKINIHMQLQLCASFLPTSERAHCFFVCEWIKTNIKKSALENCLLPFDWISNILLHLPSGFEKEKCS
mgnify:CR=1 FL=1